MTDDPQNVGPLMASLGARRIGVDHWTEHDFKMERIGRLQNAETYAERLKILEAAGWVPSSGPFYYARREYHRGYTHPDLDVGHRGRVPPGVAFAMFKEGSPDIELPPYKPHPEGWKRPKPPEGAGLFHNELVSAEPMKMPTGALFALADNYEYGTPEEAKARREKKARRDATFKDLPGVRSYGEGSRRVSDASPGSRPEDYIHVLLEAEEYRAGIPETWEGLPVGIRVQSEADERAEKEAKDKAAYERYQEEAAWVRKGDRL